MLLDFPMLIGLLKSTVTPFPASHTSLVSVLSRGVLKSNLSSPFQARKLNMLHSPMPPRISSGYTNFSKNFPSSILYPYQQLFIVTTKVQFAYPRTPDFMDEPNTSTYTSILSAKPSLLATSN